MREAMAGRLVSLLVPVTWMAGMAAGTRGGPQTFSPGTIPTHHVSPTEITPPPNVSVTSRDALVIVNISVPDTSSYLVLKDYNVTLRRNGSSEEKSKCVSVNPFIIPPSDLLPEQSYCMTVHVCKNHVCGLSPFGPEKCFTAPAKGPPNNLTMDALDLRYLLKWDWNFNQSPNATFSVERCTYYNAKCTTIQGCENITTTQCNCLDVHFNGECIFRVSAYDREEKSSNVIQFAPHKDTIIGPPKDLKMQIVGNELDINVSAPEGFRESDIYSLCDWRTHLEYWTNSTHSSQDKEDPFFRITSLEASTTYCAKAKVQCANSNRSSQYSEVYCITTDPKSYLVPWITGFAFLGIVVISVVLYMCLFPFKRYIKHTFFPPRRLPSCIEKGFGESSLDCIKHPFLLHEEETMDRCYIVHTKDLVQMNDKNASKADSQDSGNCSNEGQTTGETITSDPSV